MAYMFYIDKANLHTNNSLGKNAKQHVVVADEDGVVVERCFEVRFPAGAELRCRWNKGDPQVTLVADEYEVLA